MLQLPEEYLNRMRKLLGDEYGEFLESYEQAPMKGLRFNRLKIRQETREKLIRAWELKKVSWCEEGYEYAAVRPGLSPYHDAGVFYMQEPSAMCVAEEAGLTGNEFVLDLCAAPGGKTTAAAEKCYLLVSNEIISNRARILSSNVERMGLMNTVVCSASPDRLADCFPGSFDVVITDAPCSGEGMMRKDDTAIAEWSTENVDNCILRQRDILRSAAQMVRPGGKLIYSTCTFEEGENELQIEAFLKDHKDFRLLSMKRIWPHKERGEGHFCAVLSNGEPADCPQNRIPLQKLIKQTEKRLSGYGIHILRSGIMKGSSFTDKKGRTVYEPSHAEIMCSSFENCQNGVNLLSEEDALYYLKGNVLRISPETCEMKGTEGYCGIYYDGYPLGLGKRIGDTIKNHLPKGLRHV